MTRQNEQHQGALTPTDLRLRDALSHHKWLTTLEVQRLTGCASARDRIRKLRANGVPIGDAKRLYKAQSGATVFGWRLEEMKDRRVAA